MARKLVPPPKFQRYDCQCCGLCCRVGFLIRVTDEERERILALGWDDDEDLKDRELFIAERGGGWRFAHRPDGSCIFLNEAGRCRIHERFGEKVKALACRAYPFVLTPAGDQTRVSVRFDCPAVTQNAGRPLTAHLEAMKHLADEALRDYERSAPPAVFKGNHRLPYAQLVRIVETLDHLLTTDSLDLTRRVIACVTVTQLLNMATVGKLEGAGLAQFLQLATEAAAKDASSDTLERKRPKRGVLLLFRQVLGLYGRKFSVTELDTSLLARVMRSRTRLRQALSLAHGRGKVPRLRFDFPTVSFPELERSFGPPTRDGADLLLRFYRLKLTGMAFFGPACFGYGFLEGAFALWLTYPVSLWYARFFAAGEGRDQLTDEAIERAVLVLDHNYARSAAFALSAERRRFHLLSDPDNLRALVTWYGS